MRDNLARRARYRRGHSYTLDPDPISNGPWSDPDAPAALAVGSVIAWLDAAQALRAAGYPPIVPDTVREAWRHYAREIRDELRSRQTEALELDTSDTVTPQGEEAAA